MTQTVLLGDIAQIFDGPHATPKKISSGPVFLGISNLNNGRLDLTNTAHLSIDDLSRWTKRVTPTEGDIVFSYETRLGEAAMIPEGFYGCLGRRMGLLRTVPSKVDREFLLYYWLSPQFQAQIQAKKIHGSTVERIALTELPKFEISLPTLDKQKKIADILGAIDEKIELNRKMNETLKQMGQTLFRHYFISKPEVEKWKEVRLKDIASYIGRGISPKYDESGDSLVINQRCIRNGRLDLANARKQSKPYGSEKALKPGDVLINSTGVGTLGRVAQVDEIQDGVTFDSHVTIVRPNVDIIFFGAMMRNLETVFEDMGSGTTGQTELSRVAVGEVKVKLPPNNEIVQFKDEVTPMRKRMQQNDEEIQTLTTLRDALLPRLISGRVKV